MSVISSLASVSGVCLAFSGLFQVQKIFLTRSAKDIAPATYWMGIVGSLIWVLYGLELNSFPIVLSNALGFLVTALILVGFYRYGKRKNKKRH